MEMSENIGELAKALSAAQGELPNAVGRSKGHGYDYAKLIEYNELAKPVLPKHGLAVVQLVDSNESGGMVVHTLLTHSSGQWLKASASVPAAVLMGGAGKNPVQVAGAAITYMRRYQYAAILGMTDNAEDNDAAGYVAPKPQPQPKPQPAPQATVELNETQALPDDLFQPRKHQWAVDAKKHGKGGMDRLLLHVNKWSKGQYGLTNEQDNEIRSIIMDLAKAEKEADDGYQTEGERQAHAMFGV